MLSSVPNILASLLGLRYSKFSPASGPLHSLFPLPGMSSFSHSGLNLKILLVSQSQLGCHSWGHVR